MYIEKILHKCCKYKPCRKIAIYEFNDVKKTKPEGSVAEHVETIILGYSCEHHVEEVNKMLKE